MNCAELLRLFRSRRGADKTLLDLEEHMRAKLAILKRNAKRKPNEYNRAKVDVYGAAIAEVHSSRFDVIARRVAMPRASVFA